MSAVEYISKNEFVWWQGMVEDVHDPMRAGRVRVRIVGWHNPDKDQLPTKSLPWALAIMPVTSASTSGIGNSSTGLVPGSMVIGFFRDGQLAQQPVIFGSILGIPLEGPPGSSYGYGDPRLNSLTGGYYMPNERMLGATGEIGRFSPRSGHYVGSTFDPGREFGFGQGGLASVGGIAKYEYDFYKKGITHANSQYGNIYPRYWGGPTGSISPITDVNTLAGGCGPEHGSKILQEYILDRASLGTILPVPKFRPVYEIPLMGYEIPLADLVTVNGGIDNTNFSNPTDARRVVKKFDLGAGGGFRTGDEIFGRYGGLPPLPDGISFPNELFPIGIQGVNNPFYGFETTTTMRGNEYFERVFGATTEYISITTGNGTYAASTISIDEDGNTVYYVVDKNNPWVFCQPQGTTYTRQYPYNHVYESESGHIMEFDDTNGGERIKIAHRLGTSEEIIEDGSKIEQVVNDKYTRVLGDHNTVVGGNSIFFGERGFKAIINAEAIYYPQGSTLVGRPPAHVAQGPDSPEGMTLGIDGTTADPFVYGPGFLGTGETGGPGWWDADINGRLYRGSNGRLYYPDGTTYTSNFDGSEFFVDPERELDVFEGNYQIEKPEGVTLDPGAEFYGGYRGLSRMNFFKGGNTDVIVAYGNVNLHVMRGNVNVRVDDGDMNLELLNGNMKSYISGDHYQRIDGNEIKYIAGNRYTLVRGKSRQISRDQEITTRGGLGILNNYVPLDFTSLRDIAGDSPFLTPQGNGPVDGGGWWNGSDQELRGLNEQIANYGGNPGDIPIIGGLP